MKRTRAYWVLAVSFALNLALAFTPYFPATRGVWRTDKPEQFYSVLAAFVGIDFALLTLTLGLIFLDQFGTLGGDTTSALNRMLERLPASTIRWLPDSVFYRGFLAAATEARSTVRIAYFAPTPPDTVNAPGRARYYRDIAELMRTRTEVQFFRLVRYSDANLPWMLELVREFTGTANVSIAVIANDLKPERDMPLALSVQVVDDARAWLVAIESHERVGETRDLYVESAPFADAMTRYYKRLWAVADPLLSNGNPTPIVSRYQRRLESQPTVATRRALKGETHAAPSDLALPADAGGGPTEAA